MHTTPFAARVTAIQAQLASLAACELSCDLDALRARLGITDADSAAFERARIEALCDAEEGL